MGHRHGDGTTILQRIASRLREGDVREAAMKRKRPLQSIERGEIIGAKFGWQLAKIGFQVELLLL